MSKTYAFIPIVLCLAGSVYAVGLGTDAAYSLDTSRVLAGPYDPTQFTSLDGTWAHYASDRWDGSGIGEGSPGGISPIDGYLRIQDTGDPRDYGVPDATSNCKMYLVHNIGPEGASATVLDEGVTLFFRIRLATGGLLDQLRPNGGGSLADVPATGDGYVIHDSGKGFVGIKQAARGIISFSLVSGEEDGGTSGLVMNSLNGPALSSNVDSGEGTANLIPLDPTVWHDFWVTIQADPSGVGTHAVSVTVDGGPAQTFVVTAGNANDFDGVGFIALGAGSTNISGAFDIAAFQFAPGIVVTGVACPAHGAVDVERDVVLGWTSSESGSACNVYLGTDSDGVQNADAGSPLRIGSVIDANTFDPGPLEYGQTYYWRVDKIGAAPESQVSKGHVWSFTVEPFARAITADRVTATASSQSPDMGGPERTADGSGLNALDQHDTMEADMWTSDLGQQPPVWIHYAFDNTVKLHQMHVWNSNSALEWLGNWGVKTATVEYSTDGTTWTALADVPEFAQAPGSDAYDSYTTVDFGGVAAQFVRMTFTSSWGDGTQYGLSEVRFLAIPVSARDPHPVHGAVGVPLDTTLSWRAGREAASHEVYLGTDPNALALAGTASTNSYAPADLILGTQYSWRVDEVNTAEAVSRWPGEVWAFTVVDSVCVDDFESYTNDSPKRVFQTWIDGLGFEPDAFFPSGTLGNGTGAVVGYNPAERPVMEYAIVHDGRQFMPLTYTGLSETTRTFEPPQDWSRYGITTLVLHFCGDVNNVGAPLYVKINGTQVQYNQGTPSTTLAEWTQWNIPLASFGAALKSVTTLTIGVGSGSAGATGILFIDDIRLYAVPPEALD